MLRKDIKVTDDFLRQKDLGVVRCHKSINLCVLRRTHISLPIDKWHAVFDSELHNNMSIF